MNKLLSEKDIQNDLVNLNGWIYDNNKIKKELHFRSYMDSIDFINSVAKKAEQVNHHPNLIVGSYYSCYNIYLVYLFAYI